jgi:NADPH:quinone reductase-like Zn-dependent oxidoreductase
VRAVVVHEAGGPEVLRVEEMPDPQPREGEVLVRVEAVGINHVDLSRRAGGADTFPLIIGYDGAGQRVDTGDRVLVTSTSGTYAELVSAKEENVFAIPDSLDTAAAAAIGVPYKTAWWALVDMGGRRRHVLRQHRRHRTGGHGCNAGSGGQSDGVVQSLDAGREACTNSDCGPSA